MLKHDVDSHDEATIALFYGSVSITCGSRNIDKNSVPAERMDGCINETRHVICLGKFENNQRYKEQIIREIVAVICAMLNSNGGKVVIDIETDSNETPAGGSPFSQMSLVIRILEQSMISIIGLHQTISNINFREDNESKIILVKKVDSLITINYNLYLPSQTQVVQVSPLEPKEKVKDDIIDRKVILEPVQTGSHCQIFRKDAICGIRESKTVQLKYLEAQATKRTTLADRIIGKGNKFICYVSAFANYSGGHIYYGVSSYGVVIGELIENEENKKEITKKVEKVIKKMIWPERIGQPRQGEHWDIFFEPVVDKDNKPIPSTFVIVIYIAACVGGVFAEEPECYEMTDEKIRKMSLVTWKRRVSQPIKLSDVNDIPFNVKRISWSSTRVQSICVFADHVLTLSVNNGESIAPVSLALEHVFPSYNVEVKLLVLSKQVMVNYRSKRFTKAQILLKEYSELQNKSTEFWIFDAIRVYLQIALYRAQGDFESLSDILPEGICKIHTIEPGMISAAISLLVATIVTLAPTKDDKWQRNPVVFSVGALEHLQDVEDSPVVRADMEQKSHITSALHYLGCDITGKLASKEIDSESLEKANASIIAVKKSAEDNPMNHYRDTQFNITNSVLFYRRSEVELDKKLQLLQEAFNFAKRAECIAAKYKFAEMLDYARTCMAKYTESLLRTRFKSMSKKTPGDLNEK